MTRYQKVSIDLVNMVYTAIAYLALAGAAWLFLRLIQACFWLPGHMKRQNDVQRMLQSKIESYERYIAETEAKEDAEEFVPQEGDNRTREERRKERQECLDMLKNELKRIQDGGDPYDLSHLLSEEDRSLISGADDEDEEDGLKSPEESETEKQLTDVRETEKKVINSKEQLSSTEPKKIK